MYKKNKFIAIVESLALIIKEKEIDEYDKPIIDLVDRFNSYLIKENMINESDSMSPNPKSKLFNNFNYNKKNITHLWAYGLLKYDLLDLDYIHEIEFSNNNKDYYECSYYNGFEAPYRLIMWEGSLNTLEAIIKKWAIDYNYKYEVVKDE